MHEGCATHAPRVVASQVRASPIPRLIATMMISIGGLAGVILAETLGWWVGSIEYRTTKSALSSLQSESGLVHPRCCSQGLGPSGVPCGRIRALGGQLLAGELTSIHWGERGGGSLGKYPRLQPSAQPSCSHLPCCPSPCRGSGLGCALASLSGTSPQQEVGFFLARADSLLAAPRGEEKKS